MTTTEKEMSIFMRWCVGTKACRRAHMLRRLFDLGLYQLGQHRNATRSHPTTPNPGRVYSIGTKASSQLTSYSSDDFFSLLLAM